MMMRRRGRRAGKRRRRRRIPQRHSLRGVCSPAHDEQLVRRRQTRQDRLGRDDRRRRPPVRVGLTSAPPSSSSPLTRRPIIIIPSSSRQSISISIMMSSASGRMPFSLAPMAMAMATPVMMTVFASVSVFLFPSGGVASFATALSVVPVTAVVVVAVLASSVFGGLVCPGCCWVPLLAGIPVTSSTVTLTPIRMLPIVFSSFLSASTLSSLLPLLSPPSPLPPGLLSLLLRLSLLLLRIISLPQHLKRVPKDLAPGALARGRPDQEPRQAALAVVGDAFVLDALEDAEEAIGGHGVWWGREKGRIGAGGGFNG